MKTASLLVRCDDGVEREIRIRLAARQTLWQWFHQPDAMQRFELLKKLVTEGKI